MHAERRNSFRGSPRRAARHSCQRPVERSPDRTEAFFNGLACRNAQVLGGQNNIGAILYHDPMEKRPRERDASGNPIYRLGDTVRPLGVFRVARPDATARETSRVSTVFSSNSGAFAILDYLKRAHET